MKIVSKIIDACLIEKKHMLFNIRIKDQIQTITETTELNKPSITRLLAQGHHGSEMGPFQVPVHTPFSSGT